MIGKKRKLEKIMKEYLSLLDLILAKIENANLEEIEDINARLNKTLQDLKEFNDAD